MTERFVNFERRVRLFLTSDLFGFWWSHSVHDSLSNGIKRYHSVYVYVYVYAYVGWQ